MPQQPPNPCKCREYTWSLQTQLPSNSRFSVQWMDCSGKLHELKDTTLTSGTITCSSLIPRFILNKVRYRNVTVVEGDCCCKCYEFSTTGSNPCFSRIRNCETNKFNLIPIEDMDTICSSIVPLSNCAWPTEINNCIYDSNTSEFSCSSTTTMPTTTTTTIPTTTTTTCDCVTIEFDVKNSDLQAATDNVLFPNKNHAVSLNYVDCDTQSTTSELVYYQGVYKRCILSSGISYTTMQYSINDTTFVNYPNMDSTITQTICCISGTTTTTTTSCYVITSVDISQGSLSSSEDNSVYMFYENCLGDSIILSFNQSGPTYLDGTDCVLQMNEYSPEISFWIFNGPGMKEVTFQNDFTLGQSCVVSTSTTRPCYEFSVVISQQDINLAVNNSTSYFNGTVFLGYTPCDGYLPITNTYTAATTEVICIENPIISLYYFTNDQYNFATNSYHTQIGNCSITTTTTTGSIVTTTTTV